MEGATVHYSKVSDWTAYVQTTRVVIVGGGEAGMDAALYLLSEMEAGEVVVVDRGGSKGEEGRVDDPSTTLAPVTRERLESALRDFGGKGGVKKLAVLTESSCVGVEKCEGGWEVRRSEERDLSSLRNSNSLFMRLATLVVCLGEGQRRERDEVEKRTPHRIGDGIQSQHVNELPTSERRGLGRHRQTRPFC